MKTDAMRMMMKVMIVCATFVGMNVLAQNATWTGNVDTNWSNAGNWSPAVVPNGNTYTAVVDSASATINVDSAYTVNKFMIVSNGVESGSTVLLEGPGPLTIDINAATTSGIENLAEGAGTILEINCDVTIANSAGTGGGQRTEVNQSGGTANVIRFGTDCTLTLNSHLLVADEDGLMEFNCTVLGGSPWLVYSENVFFGNGFDRSGHTALLIPASTESKITMNGGTLGEPASFVQANGGGSLATLVFNAPDVVNGVNFRGGGGFNLVATANQSNIGTLEFGSDSIIDPAGGTFVFSDSATRNWGSASLTITTNFSFGDIRFGTTSNALTEIQLLAITADGESGGAVLDVDGFLDFAGPPPVITGETVVDYDTNGGNTNARPADVISSNGYTWAFSETEPLFDNAGQNRTIYGGLIASWTVATNYVPVVLLTNGLIYAQVNPPGTGAATGGALLKGMYVWPKEEFLLGSEPSTTLSFTNGNAMTITENFMWGGVGGQSFRFVAKQGGTYYASDAAITSGGNFQTLLEDPSDTNILWAVISTNDYSIGGYGAMTFTDVEAVGIAFEINHTQSGSFVAFGDFQTRATVEYAPLTEISDVSGALVGGQYVVSWQGTNTATYILQMKNDLVFDPSWVDVATNSGVNDIMTLTNATDDTQAFFRTILAE